MDENNISLPLNEIVIGNCVDTMHRFPNDCLDLTITSPPYDKLRIYNGYCFDFENVARELYRITKPGGIVVWNVADSTERGSETLTSFKQAIFFVEGAGFNLHDTMIWHKSNPMCFGDRQNRYVQAHEYMFVFSKGKPKTFNALKEPCKTAGQIYTSVKKMGKGGPVREIIEPKRKNDFKPRSNVWLMGHASKSWDHPAPFPEQLAEDHIVSWTNIDEIVFDPFMGCYDKETQVLTYNGWKYFSCLLKSDKIITRDKSGLLSYQLPIKYYQYKHVGEMIRVKSRSTDLLVTANHNMYVLTHNDFLKNREPQFIKATDLKKVLYRIPEGGNFSPPLLTIPKEIMYLIGLYVSEGYFANWGNKKKLTICQNRGEKCNCMMQWVSNLNPRYHGKRKFVVDLNDEWIEFILKNCGSGKYNKFLSPMILNNQNLDCLFDAMMLGNGCKYKTKRGYYSSTYYTVSPNLRNGFEELCLKLGFETSCRTRIRSNSYIKGRKISKSAPINEIRVRHSKNKKIIPKIHISKEFYNDAVYCAEVPNHTLYVKRNGYCTWCGNSGTTAVMALKHKRKFIGCEISEEYINKAYERIEQSIEGTDMCNKDGEIVKEENILFDAR